MNRARAIAIAALAGLVIAGVAAAAPPVVRVAGAGRAMTNQHAAAILAGAGFPSDAAVRALQEAYMAEGYLFTTIDVTRQPDSTYAVMILEGDPARIGASRIGGASFRPVADLRRALGIDRGELFEPRRLARRIDEALATYDEAGYPFAQIWVDGLVLHADSGTVDVSLYIVEGTRRDITGVVIEGLAKTRPETAARIAGVTPGTPYSARVLEDIYLRMVSSGVFRGVDFPTVRVASDGRGVDAVVHVDEPRQSHSFAAAVGYASSEAGRDRILSGLAQLDLNNIGGTLKDFGALWTGDGNGRTETRIRYRDRLFLGKRLGVGLRLEQTGQDTLYTWQSLGLDVERGFGRMAGTLTSFSAGAFADRNVFSTGSIVRSFRVRGRVGADGLWGSERGARYGRLGLAASLAHKTLTYREGATGPGDVRQMIYEATAEAIVPTFWSLHYGLTGAFRTLESPESSVPLSEQFYIGGARTVRGYRENQFHGRRIGYARNELRLGRTPQEGLYLFLDAGFVRVQTVLEDGRTAEGTQGMTGFGFGVRSESKLGRIDLSFAVGEEISLQATKVHVLLEQNF